MYMYIHACIIDEVFDELMMWITVICQILKTSLSIDNRIDHFIELKYDTLLLSLLPVRHYKTYTGGTKPVERVYLKPGEPIGIKCRVRSKKKLIKHVRS